uniref:TF-B3 domain-containing protein n=1 Tax=Leersia perrieri TaxID=77586 RepID=A0A0D9VWB4_9ORYZ
MRKPNTRSTERVEYYLCNRMDNQEKHFFKVMIGDFHNRMIIPENFEYYFKGVITKTIKLETCNGTFDVQITKKLNRMVLGSGWEPFVSAHGLKMGEYSPSEHESVESADLQTSQEPYILLHFSYLSDVQKERVDALIQKIQPKITVFVAIMRYAALHFPHESRNVTVQRPCKSKKWHPTFYKRKDGSINILRGYWSYFVQDNRVQEHDICVFVPTKHAGNFTFTVHLLCTSATCSMGGTCVDRIGSSVGTTHAVNSSIVMEEPIEADDVSLENCRNGVSDESEDSEDSEGPADPPYIIVKEKVRSIQSKVPLYVALMKKTNIELTGCHCQLEFGACYSATVHLPDRRQTVLLERLGKIWATMMHVKNGRSMRRFLINGWNRFVRENRLRIGDICLLELKTHETKKLTIAVHAISSNQR